MKTQAKNIITGDTIVLRDGKTHVKVVETKDTVNSVLIYWKYDGQKRHMHYSSDETIEVIIP